jgi:hypothetical protein
LAEGFFPGDVFSVFETGEEVEAAVVGAVGGEGFVKPNAGVS